MKNQYFGDSRDLLKYDLLTELAHECVPGRRLTFIPMLTPESATREGNVFRTPREGHRPAIAGFLGDCVAQGRRHIREIETLMPTLGVSVSLYELGDPPRHFDHCNRTEYFAGVPDQWLRGSVVFLDPDIGIERGSLSYMAGRGLEKYVMWTELAGLWDRMDARSVLVVYQHLQNDKRKIDGDVRKRLEDLASRTAAAAAVHDRDVAFLVSAPAPLDRAAIEVARRFASRLDLAFQETPNAAAIGATKPAFALRSVS